MNTQALPYITVLGFLFGSTLVASRFSVGQFQPSTYIGLQLTIAGLAYILTYLLGRRRFNWPRDGRLWRRGILLGVLGTAVPMTSIVTALQYISSGLASILITTSPAITVIMAHFWLADERLNWRKGGGVLLALSGTVLLAASGESGLANVDKADPRGYLLLLLAMVCGSGAAIFLRKYMRGYRPFDVATIRMVSAAIVVMPLSVLFVGFDLQPVTSSGYLALAYSAAVGTFAGLLLAVYNVKRFGATAAVMTAYLVPIFALLGGVLLLDERITLVMLGGVTLILLGVFTINRSS